MPIMMLYLPYTYQDLGYSQTISTNKTPNLCPYESTMEKFWIEALFTYSVLIVHLSLM